MSVAPPAKGKGASKKRAIQKQAKQLITSTVAYPAQLENEQCVWDMAWSKVPPDEVLFCLQTLRRAMRELKRPWKASDQQSHAEFGYDMAYLNLISHVKHLEECYEKGDFVVSEVFVRPAIRWVRFLRKDAGA